MVPELVIAPNEFVDVEKSLRVSKELLKVRAVVVKLADGLQTAAVALLRISVE